LIVAPLVVGAYGLLVERTLIRPLYGRDINYPLLLTFGLQFIMIEIVRIFWGTSDHPFSAPDMLSTPVEMFGIFFFPSYRLFLIGVTIVICFVLWFFLEKTDLGLVIRAGTRDALMVRALGIDMGRIWWLVFGIGSALAGLAGILASPIRSVFPEMGTSMLVECFVVVVVGGMGSLKGAIFSGIIIGEAIAITTLFYPQFADIVIFLVMAIVLLIRPSGLFGKTGLLE
jgi:branched-chain amino acid transport system permease protein